MTIFFRLLLTTIFLQCVVPATGFGQISRHISPNNLIPEGLKQDWFRYWTIHQQGNEEASDQAFKFLLNQMAELGIENMDVLSTVLLTEARRKSEKGDFESAVSLSEKAKQLAPNFPPAYFWKGNFILKHRPWKIFTILDEYVNGTNQLFKSAWILLYGIGAGLLWIIGAFFVSTFIFVISIMSRYSPRLFHFVREISRGKLSTTALYFFLACIIIGPIWLGWAIAWIIPWWMVIFWVFMTKNEKIITVAFIILVSITGTWLPSWVSIILAKNSDVFIVMNQSIRNDTGIPSDLLIPPQDDRNLSRARFSMAMGLQYKRAGKYDLALVKYSQAIESMPNDPRILINIGNVYFLQDDFNKAIDYYNSALELDSSYVEAHFNLAQAYRENLSFNEGEQHYQEAINIDPSRIQQVTDRADRGYAQTVLDVSHDLSEVLSEAWVKTGEVDIISKQLFASFWGISLGSAPIMIIYLGLLLGVLQWRSPSTSIPFSCSLCGKTICVKCQKHIFHLKICLACQQEKRNVKRLVELHRDDRPFNQRLTMAKIISLFIPGTGHLYLLHSLKGYLILVVYVSLVLAALWKNHLFFVPYYGLVNQFGLGIIGLAFGLVLVYGLVFLDLFRLKDVWKEP